VIFNTWMFAVFAIITLTIYWLFVPQRFRPYYIVVAGCIFYVYYVPAYLVLILALGLLTYFTGIMVSRTRENPRSKKLWMILGVSAIVGVLALFKYSKFFALTVNEASKHDILPIPHLIVPLAISFFTFEFVHVLVDIYLGKIDRLDPLDFATFSMFFPTLVAGPIKRYQSFAPQVRHIAAPSNGTFALNLYRVVIGLTKKVVIADSMTLLTQPILTPNGDPFGRLDYIVAILAYGAKIYFDFSGYSDIAIGVSGLLGIRIPENFARPYWAQNISMFWRRWHMSLSSWIRDYVFIPLGGSRRVPLMTAFNLILAMAIAGLWHGAAWTFVVWGLWHGAGLAVHRAWTSVVVPRVSWISRPGRFVPAMSIVLTFGFVFLGWVLFAASSFGDAGTVITRVFARR
jgi:alginate O-acetyltransferase complex protein AlgI